MVWFCFQKPQHPVYKKLHEAGLCVNLHIDINGTSVRWQEGKAIALLLICRKHMLFSNMEKLQVDNVIPMVTKYSG